MNKNGQGTLGLIIIMFITILVGVVLFQVIAQTVGESVNTVSIVNSTFALTNETTTYLDFRALSDVVITNASTTDTVVAANYTITNNVINPTTGALSVGIIADELYPFIAASWNISATAQPQGYIAESGGRAMENLIVIFFALAVLVVALVPNLRNEFMDLVSK